MRVREKLQELKGKMEKNVEHFVQITSADINVISIDSSKFVSTEADKNQLLPNYFCN